MRIIPAIDIIDGKCVRLSKGNYNTKKIYNEKPLEVAKQFEDSGIKFLHLVDLDGAKSKEIVNYKTLETICSKTRLKVDFGGGIKTDKDIIIAFDNGANQITGGSVAANDPDRFQNWLEIYGRDRIILGADCIDRKIATNGWLECSTFDVVDFIISYEQNGIKNVICTDISKDGMLKGPSTNLYREILNISKTNLIASGGVSSLNDLKILKSVGCYGAIIGKAIYEGKIDLKQLKKLC
ncbi:MAG: 1-(5-phosphoribosyl)-5-[(5-phosphoribosylamino)methylideneamino]imidazole-4-carboxamide isomerase [Bacteroidetes bacterium]|nr:1-(5-phosphoribosyl)-5-[(5-phosphoribosylamino)methylideneamino]imidazole-4-carboxamide isomerase [Bacteroidota bacterium]